MPDRAETAAAVRGLILTRWPGRFGPDELPDGASLGSDGLALDSIEIVELLLDSAELVGATNGAADALLEAGPLTVGGLIDQLAR